MAEYDADIIVIGAGGLGALAATEAAKGGKSVIMLEAGPEVPLWKVVDNWRRSARKSEYPDPFGDYPWAPRSGTKGYITADTDLLRWPGTVRAVGGTSRHWTGLAWRQMPEDMKLHSTHGVGRDWPIDYDELEPFYCDAEEIIGVSGSDDQDQSGKGGGAYPPRSRPYPMPPEAKPYLLQRFQERVAEYGLRLDHCPGAKNSVEYQGRPGCIGNNFCQPECPIHAKYSGLMAVETAKAAGVQLRSNAVVDKLEADGSGKITSVGYLDRDGARTTLSSRVVIIAGHGYETPKLLLMNELANRSDQVGRNLMVHPGNALILPTDEPVWAGRGQFAHGALLQRRDLPDRNRIPSFYWAQWNPNPAAEIGAELVKAGLLGSQLDGAIRAMSSHMMMFEFISEDLPEAGNRVTLNSNWKDALGLPGLNLRYYLSDYSKRVQARMDNDAAVAAEAFGVTKNLLNIKWLCQSHIMGTTIMGDDPQTSVVDSNLRCHDHENLFLVTTGAMPSSSCVNPTLTGFALAVRAGRYIAREV